MRFEYPLVPNYSFSITVVIQTYRRVKSLLLLIKDFNGMSNLDKVLIIWNDPVKPPDDLKWPTIHVPVQVINGAVKNNNFIRWKNTYKDHET